MMPETVSSSEESMMALVRWQGIREVMMDIHKQLKILWIK
ncbi:hypothetical protein L580_2302 [Serratia fonticola AU-P3(3)]|nr:hypothetical protein L580_2302 [Serratia fonticola AU-P3(3)]